MPSIWEKKSLTIEKVHFDEEKLKKISSNNKTLYFHVKNRPKYNYEYQLSNMKKSDIVVPFDCPSSNSGSASDTSWTGTDNAFFC